MSFTKGGNPRFCALLTDPMLLAGKIRLTRETWVPGGTTIIESKRHVVLQSGNVSHQAARGSSWHFLPNGLSRAKIFVRLIFSPCQFRRPDP